MGVWTPANCSSVSCQYPTTEGPTTVTHASKVSLGQNVTNDELEVTSMAYEQTTKVILVDLEGQFLLTSLKHYQLKNIQPCQLIWVQYFVFSCRIEMAHCLCCLKCSILVMCGCCFGHFYHNLDL